MSPHATTVAPETATSNMAPDGVAGSKLGAWTNRATKPPRINDVGAVGAAVGSGERPAKAITRPPATTLTTDAVKPSCAACVPTEPNERNANMMASGNIAAVADMPAIHSL